MNNQISAEGDDPVELPDGSGFDQRDSRAHRGCGQNTLRDQHRVTGGKPTNSQEYPWVAALLRNGEQYCGGVLITDRHVLTAAHCVHRYEMIIPRITKLVQVFDCRFIIVTKLLQKHDLSLS